MTTSKGKTDTAKKKTLVIVESPSKAGTIGKFLGAGYKVMASVGHVRDLPKSKLGVDIDNDFEPSYINIRGKGDTIKELKKAAKESSKVYLATDPDREGEAISWHLAGILGLDSASNCRVTFNEITKDTVKKSIKEPRPIDQKLVDAQQARRVLDRLVGYQISPILWTKVKYNTSAGRVQSAALKIICDRELAIRNFIKEEYWTIKALFNKDKIFEASLIEIDGKSIKAKKASSETGEGVSDSKTIINDKATADSIIADLKAGEFRVADVEEKVTSRKPYAPYTTSTMQQDASARLNFNSTRTMKIAQQLYEGISLKGRGQVGLITYMRTDSVRVSAQAVGQANEYIRNNYGEEYIGNNFFSNKKKDAQDAHEAIRPADVSITPDSIKNDLTSDQYRLYRLIWSRFVASRMAAARYNSVGAMIDNGRYRLRAQGSRLIFDGFRKVYSPGKNEDTLLPELEKGDLLTAEDVIGDQKFTAPPPRFTEGSLVKELEEKGIGRPSTYASIISTLTARHYIKRSGKTLLPLELGFAVTDFMSDYFKEIVDVDFTARMEDRLDDIEIRDQDWKDVIRKYYNDTLVPELKTAEEEAEKVKVKDEPTGEMCPLCGQPLVTKHGRFGTFVGCSGYPECNYIKKEEKVDIGTGVKCPSCGKEIMQRKSRRGKVFYGCSGYPTCKTAYWDKPTGRMCPECGEMLVEKEGKKGVFVKCSRKECKYKEK